MKCHLTSLFERLTRKDETLRVSRSNKAYSFFRTEYPKESTITADGDLIIRRAPEEPREVRDYFQRVIGVGSNSYSFFLNEYRQNSPTRDNNGNIILNDEIIKSRTR